MKAQKKKTLGSAVTEHEKHIFEQFARSRGTTPSALLRRMMNAVCPEIAPDAYIKRDLRKKQMLIVWMDAEFESLQRRAGEEGCSTPEIVRKIVRANLHKEPTFNPRELSALLESNRQLAAIGRNLNQIARSINMSADNVEMLRGRYIENFAGEVRRHMDDARRMIRANYLRFGDEENE